MTDCVHGWPAHDPHVCPGADVCTGCTDPPCPDCRNGVQLQLDYTDYYYIDGPAGGLTLRRTDTIDPGPYL